MTRRLPEVTVYAGPMRSGKTTKLFHKMGELANNRKPFEAFKPGVDVRDAAIIPRGYNHPSVGSNCRVVKSLEAIPAEELAEEGVHTIFLEEWFMFGFDRMREPIDGLYLDTMSDWQAAGINRVFASGLDMAANGNTFRLVSDARKYGAKVVVCTAKCEFVEEGGRVCRATARNSQIYDDSDGLVFDMDTLPELLPEGLRPNDRYRPVCAEHLVLPAEMTKSFVPELVSEPVPRV